MYGGSTFIRNACELISGVSASYPADSIRRNQLGENVTPDDNKLWCLQETCIFRTNVQIAWFSYSELEEIAKEADFSPVLFNPGCVIPPSLCILVSACTRVRILLIFHRRSGRGVDHQPLLALRLGLTRSIPLLLLFTGMACCGETFTFFFFYQDSVQALKMTASLNKRYRCLK